MVGFMCGGNGRKRGLGGRGAREVCMDLDLGERAQCKEDTEKNTCGATGVWLLEDAGGPGILHTTS